jgi:hypothetical protein
MDRHGDRFLYEYNPHGKKPSIDKTKKHPVPSDWTGDPETFYVALETIQDVAVGSRETVNLTPEIKRLLDNGDRILVTDFEDTVIGEVVKRENKIVLERQPGFGL